MKMRNRLGMMAVGLGVLAGSLCGSVADGDSVRSNVFEKVRAVFCETRQIFTIRAVYVGGDSSADDEMIFRRFLDVRGGGVFNELEGSELVAFSNLCLVVSNNAANIANSWRSYATNECVRFTVLSAVGCSGCMTFTNFTDRILSVYESTGVGTGDSRCFVLSFLVSPYGTPMERYFVNSYDQGGVSNLLVRISAIFAEENRTNDVLRCNRILSGETKRLNLQEAADGGQP